MNFRIFIDRFFKGITILVVILYLIACLTPFIDPGKFWIVALAGLGFPFLLMLLFILLIIWAFKNRKWVFVIAVLMLFGFKQIQVMVGFNFPKDFSIEKKPGVLRVLTWNVSRWDERNKEKRGGVSYRPLMLDFIREQGADILCFQEFFECKNPVYFESTVTALNAMGYPFHFFHPAEELFDGSFQYGVAIFSRYPIVDTGWFENHLTTHSEGVIFTDINFGDQRVRIFTSHLVSVGFVKNDYQNVGNIAESKNILRKIKYSYELRSDQAKGLREIIDQSPYMSIVSSDLDDVPNSYSYFKIKGDLADAFLKKGSGLGRTLRFISPTLRIDYLFAHKVFNVKQVYRPELIYSDHYPLIVDFGVPPKIVKTP